MSTLKSRRLGKFRIGTEMIDENPDYAILALHDCIILRAECLHHLSVIEYFGIHPSFQEVPKLSAIPEYNINFTEGKTPNGLRTIYRKFEKV